MPCITSDGRLQPSARLILKCLDHPCTAEETAVATSLPLFRVRSALRELSEAKLIAQSEDRYLTLEAGWHKLAEQG